MNWLSHAKMYTKIDLLETYNLMHVWKVTNGKQHFEHIMAISSMCHQRKLNISFCCSYLIHREGDVTCNRQGDVILKLEHLQIQVMFIILDDKFFLAILMKIWRNSPC
jgi:hypothetical protein